MTRQQRHSVTPGGISVMSTLCFFKFVYNMEIPVMDCGLNCINLRKCV